MTAADAARFIDGRHGGLLSGASFEKVPKHWAKYWHADSAIRQAAKRLGCTVEQASEAFLAVNNYPPFEGLN